MMMKTNTGSALKEIFKRFEEKNNPERKSHEDNIIEQYSIWVTDVQGTKCRAIPIELIDDFINAYCKQRR